jgi:hypothetical protein
MLARRKDVWMTPNKVAKAKRQKFMLVKPAI